MKNYFKLFYLGDPSFHIVESDSDNFKDLMSYMKKKLPIKAFLTKIDLADISDKNSLFKNFKEAFYFPNYFGNNWDAFDECMTDLGWIKSGSYTLILKNLEKMRLDAGSNKIFLSCLKDITREWRNGRHYKKSFSQPPTPFNIIFASETANIDKLILLLKSNGIQDIGTFNEIKDVFEK